jgi:hypothetical protein
MEFNAAIRFEIEEIGSTTFKKLDLGSKSD